MPELTPTAAHHRDELIARAEAAPSASEVFAAASPRLRRLVQYDSAIWLATDPETGMPTSPTRKENFHEFNERECLMVWEREFSIEDVIPYTDLGRAPRPAAALRLATRDRPARSHRFRDLSAHTVRSYVKGIFERVGVSSRGELVATLFAEHHAPMHLDTAGIDHVTFDT